MVLGNVCKAWLFLDQPAFATNSFCSLYPMPLRRARMDQRRGLAGEASPRILRAPELRFGPKRARECDLSTGLLLLGPGPII
jgi:hypothetical protein